MNEPLNGRMGPRGSSSFYALFFSLAFIFHAAFVAPAYAGNAGSFLRAYPLPLPTKQYQIIETTSPLPVPEGYAMPISATPGEFTSATFVLRAGEALSGVNVQSSALTGPGTIAAGNVNIRVVKTWYQASSGNCACDVGTFLIPELLLKDDALINTDRVATKSYLRATVNGTQRYVDITTLGAPIPAGMTVQDAAALQSFSMALNTNKQVWLTVQVPAGAPAGTYTGTITVSATGKADTTLSLTMTVLPFVLSPSPIDQAMFYRGLLNTSCSTLDSECKTQTQMSAELINMRDHGILYPSVYDHYNSPLLATHLSLMASAGLPKDRIYSLGDSFTAIGAYDQTSIASVVRQWNSIASANGWGQVHDFGIDEATGTTFDSETTSFQTVHSNGGKVITAIPDVATSQRPNAALVDTVVLYGYFATASDVAALHALAPGKKVLMYGGPFTDMENPQYVRKHYGFAVLLKGYDGVMNYAYQDSRAGGGWNDFTQASTGGGRIFAWAYPTSNGVVDTLQWEGYREAMNDIRYAATLATVKGWTKAQLVSYLQGLSTITTNPDGIDADGTRQTIITQILASLPAGGCTYAINPGAASPASAGGSGTISLNTAAGCAWTAQSNAAWITVVSGATGSGNGSVGYSVASNTGAARSGTLAVAGQTFTVNQAAGSVTCTFSLDATSASLAAGGGSGTINVTTTAGCTWTAQSNAAWITVTGGASGSGNGSVSYSVATNSGGARTGTISVAGQTFTVTQAAPTGGCAYSLSATSASAGEYGGIGTFNVTTAAGCAWTAQSNAAWITVTSVPSGSGNGSVSWSLARNLGAARTGTISVADQTFTVTQAAQTGCTYSLSATSTSLAAGGGSGTINVTATSGCTWTAQSNAAWITVTSGASGSGNGSVSYSVATNSGGARTGILTVAGQTFTVTQAATCTYSLNATSASPAAGGGSGTINVTAASGCAWTAQSNAAWITVTGGASGSGNGSVSYSVAANSGGARTGTITVAGQTFTVTQAAPAGCTYSLSTTSASAGANGGIGTFNVTTAAGCAWTAQSNAAWITVTSVASGTGNGSVSWSLARNTGAARSGTITVAGQTFTVTQAAQTGGCSYSLSATSASAGVNGGIGTFNVTAASGCAWTAQSNAAWITVTSAPSGSGNGSVSWSLAKNSTGAARSGTISVGGQTFTISQRGA